jgi:hypothetical protein
MGVDFIHSDADAVWLRNPLDRFFADRDADLIVSQGTAWPHDVHARWGLVLCCGLFYVHASKKMSAFMAEMLRDMRTSRDDQVSFNRVVASDEVEWEIHEPYRMAFKTRTFTCSRQVIEGRGKHLRIRVLPHHLFQRMHMPGEPAYVKHVFSEKTAESTKEMLERTGCYLLGTTLPPRPGLLGRLAGLLRG